MSNINVINECATSNCKTATITVECSIAEIVTINGFRSRAFFPETNSPIYCIECILKQSWMLSNNKGTPMFKTAIKDKECPANIPKDLIRPLTLDEVTALLPEGFEEPKTLDCFCGVVCAIEDYPSHPLSDLCGFTIKCGTCKSDIIGKKFALRKHFLSCQTSSGANSGSDTDTETESTETDAKPRTPKRKRDDDEDKDKDEPRLKKCKIVEDKEKADAMDTVEEAEGKNEAVDTVGNKGIAYKVAAVFAPIAFTAAYYAPILAPVVASTLIGTLPSMSSVAYLFETSSPLFG